MQLSAKEYSNLTNKVSCCMAFLIAQDDLLEEPTDPIKTSSSGWKISGSLFNYFRINQISESTQIFKFF